jgi:FAD/FMN-containing dehydrogenase
LCGTFGAFGIITDATVMLHPLPQQTTTALVATRSAADAIDLLVSLESELGDFVSAFEGISRHALQAILRHGVPSPFSEAPAYSVLVELSTSTPVNAGMDLESQLTAWLERRLTDDLVLDAVVGKPEQLWRMRHGISEAVQGLGRMVAFDIAVARSRFGAFRAQAVQMAEQMVAGAVVCDFGHLGDGGVHLNIVVPTGTPDATVNTLRDAVYALTVVGFDGTFSAEHGVGPVNQRWYTQYTEAAKLELAAVLHQHFDASRRLGNVRLDHQTP